MTELYNACSSCTSPQTPPGQKEVSDAASAQRRMDQRAVQPLPITVTGETCTGHAARLSLLGRISAARQCRDGWGGQECAPPARLPKMRSDFWPSVMLLVPACPASAGRTLPRPRQVCTSTPLSGSATLPAVSSGNQFGSSRTGSSENTRYAPGSFDGCGETLMNHRRSTLRQGSPPRNKASTLAGSNAQCWQEHVVMQKY